MTPDPARSLTDRIRNAAHARGTEPARIRRQLVFQRILARLTIDDAWVLKGGFSLEVRLGLRARATRDLDVTYRGATPPASALDLQDALVDALDHADFDDFVFAVALPRAIAADELGNPGWRVPIKASLGGVTFDEIRLDVVARADEIITAVETLTIAPPLAGTGFADVDVIAVNLPQHAAEKTHAYARIYAHDTPSSRVKDLIDLVLLVESGLLESEAWARRVAHVFTIRDSSAPPEGLPEPPGSWKLPYAAMAEDLALVAASAHDGWIVVDAAYRTALEHLPHTNGITR